MHTCPRCQRVNPAEAAFCYFDGQSLRAATAADIPLALPVETGPARLPHDFFFPTGRRCQTYDDLVQGCLEDWNTARELLTTGAFRQYLTGAGRLDLVRAADEAVRQETDPDQALDAFLARLPATKPPKPELELQPHKLLLGALAVGETRQAQLIVQNIGSGLLHGTLTVVEGGTWLRLAEPAKGEVVPLKVAREQTVKFAVNSASLPAPMKCAARLTVITNGGIVEVPVRLDVTPKPFAEPPYVGALNPRELAIAIRNNPKPAIAMFEAGTIPRWFETNSWGYPVIGPTAPGMAAVQQFFEALGLAKAPRIQLAEPEGRFTPGAETFLAGKVRLSTADRKWIHAQATCQASWLRITTPAVSGPQQTAIDFEIDPRALAVGAVHEATIEIVANSGQRLAYIVKVDVPARSTPSPRRRTPLPLAEPRVELGTPAWETLLPRSAPSASPETPPRAPRPPLRHPILAAALLALLLRILLAGPADVYARVWTAAPGAPTAGNATRWETAPSGTEFVRHFVLATGWVGALAGVVLMLRRGRLRDVPFGLVAGAAAGIAVSGTAACLLPVLDWPARALWRHLHLVTFFEAALWPATIAWVALAALCWAVLGAACAGAWPRR